MRELQAARGTALSGRPGHDAGRTIGAARARLVIAVVAIVGIVVDQWTKIEAVARLDPLDPPTYLGGWLTLRLIRNPGAAFSLGGGDFTIVFTALAAIATQVVLVMLVPRVRVLSWALVTGLLLAGIVGNFIDRLVREPSFLYGHVVDFIQVRYFGAIFNVADVCLTTSAALIMLLSLFGRTDFDGTVRGTATAAQTEAAAAADAEPVT